MYKYNSIEVLYFYSNKNKIKHSNTYLISIISYYDDSIIIQYF